VPQNRITDHRVDLTLYNLAAFMEGDIDPIIEPLMADELEQKLASIQV
jgi:peptide chain release factor 1